MNILIADDNLTNLKLLAATLEAEGHTVLPAPDGVEALLILEKYDIHAIISDILMPRLDGYRLCYEVRNSSRFGHLPFIFYSSTYTSPADEKLALEFGGDAFIRKPASPKVILEALRSIPSRRLRPEAPPLRPLDELGLMKEYSERLVSKLESKNVELEEINAKFSLQAAALHVAADAISITDRHGDILWVNPAYNALTGYSADELIGKNSRILKSGKQDPAFYRDLWETILAGKTWRGEFTNRRKDGTLYFGEQTITPVKTEDGSITHFVGIMKDVTQRKQAENALRESEDQYRDLFDNAHDLIQSVALDGGLLYVNQAWRDALGYNDHEIANLKVFDLVPANRQHDCKELFNQVIAGKPVKLAEIEFNTKAGTRLTLEGSVSAKWENGKAVSLRCIFRDVTEKKKLETQFLRNQRMESLGTLAGGIAHDLNNVLAPILMSLQILKLKFKDEESASILNTLEASAKRGGDMVKQVLTFSRGFEGKRIEIQLQHLIKELRTITTQTFPKNIRVRAEFPKDLWMVLGDATQFHQVLLNLCVNARDAMPQGGTLSLTAENVSLDESFARMNPEAKIGPYVVLSVADTGTGMPPDLLEKIFDPFFTTKPIGQGTGLGLSTVQGIVKNHGGFISVNSEIGKGSIFKVYLPATPANPGEQAQKKGPSIPSGKGELILVVDDEVSVRNIAQHTLGLFSYRVLTASDGAQAVALCAQNIGKISLMLTDILMPVMDGPSTIRAVKSLDPKIKIITASGLPTEPDSADTDIFRSHAGLHKPYTAEKLLKTIRDVLDTPVIG